MAKSRAKKGQPPSKRPAGRRNSKETSARRSGSRRGYWLVRLLAIGLLFGLVGSVYLLYLDHTVRSKFEGKRWAIPARVYARPLELYAGAPITPDQLKMELSRLGYRHVSYPKGPGEWSRNGNRSVVWARSFRFLDGERPSQLIDLRFAGGQVSSMRDRDGQELSLVRLDAQEIASIYPAHNEDRVLVKRDQIPQALVDALLVMEDRDFYHHRGVNPKAIARAIWANIRAGGVVQGGSTLTQQLVKNFYLTRERTLLRKLNEAAMALMLDGHYQKDEILEAYANEIYLGQDGRRAIHGFGLASEYYFNQGLKELDLSRLALLVALVRGPSFYDPRRHPERARKRRDLVLEVMQQQGVISMQQMRRARASGLGVTERKGRGQGRYPAFMELVRRQLHRDYREEDLTSEGLRIFTTLDPWQQQQGEAAVIGRLKRLEAQYRLPAGKLQAALVLAESQSGEVSALVGDRQPGYAGFNRALDALRPIGSLVKPAVYLAALMQPERYSLLSWLQDQPVTLTGPDGTRWQPQNYDRKSHGEVRLHQALAQSYNLATVNLGLELGLDAVINTLQRLGIRRRLDPLPSLLLGAISLTPLEVAQLYQTIAAGGFSSPLRAIRGVQSADGSALQRYPLTVEQSLPAGPVYLLTLNLQQVVREGTGRGLANYLDPSMNIAGKTGTTDELRDSWFAGFSGDKVAVAWLGRDDNKPAGLTGASGALRLWGDTLRRLRPQPLQLVEPESVELVWIDPDSGFLSAESCDNARQFPFIRGSGPVTRGDCAAGARTIQGLFRSLFE